MIGRLTVSLLALAVATGIAALITPASNPSTASADPSVGAAASGQASLRTEGEGGVKAAATASAISRQAAASGEVLTATLSGCREAAWPYAERSCGAQDATPSSRRVRVIQIDRIKPEGEVTAWAPPTISTSGISPTTTQSVASVGAAPTASAVQTVDVLPPPRAAEFSAGSPTPATPSPAAPPTLAVVTVSASAIVGTADRPAGEPAAFASLTPRVGGQAEVGRPAGEPAAAFASLTPRVGGQAEVGRAVGGTASSSAVQVAQAPRATGSAAIGAALDLRGAVSHVPVVAAAPAAQPLLSATGMGVASLGTGAASAVVVETTSRIAAASTAGAGSSATSVLAPRIGTAPQAIVLATAAPGSAASSSAAVHVGVSPKVAVVASAGPGNAAAASAIQVGSATKVTATAVASSGHEVVSPAATVLAGTASKPMVLAIVEQADVGASGRAALQVETTPRAAASAVVETSRSWPSAVAAAAWGAFRTAGSAQVDGPAGAEGSADVAPVVAVLPPQRPVEVAVIDVPEAETRQPVEGPGRAGIGRDRREVAVVAEPRQLAAAEPAITRQTAAPQARPERVRQAARVADPRYEMRDEPRQSEFRRPDRRLEAYERVERAPRRAPPQLEWVRETVTHRLPDGRVYVTHARPRLMDRRRWWDSDEDERPRMQARRPRGGDAVMGWLAGQ